MQTFTGPLGQKSVFGWLPGPATDPVQPEAAHTIYLIDFFIEKDPKLFFKVWCSYKKKVYPLLPNVTYKSHGYGVFATKGLSLVAQCDLKVTCV